MRHEFTLWLVGLALAIAGTAACGADGDTRPFTIIGPTPPQAPAVARLTVTNGWTDAPVPQARVTVGAETLVTDAAGQFVVDTSAPCQRTAIVASGYLDRRLSCLPWETPPRQAVVTLWPVADDAERAALQVFAFRGRGETLVQPYGLILEIPDDLPEVETVKAAWLRAGDTLATATRGAAGVRLERLQEDGAIVTPWSSPADCAAGLFAFEWDTAIAGFCGGPRVGYFAHVLHVAPARLGDDRVALRAMLYELGLRPHPLPGLMNTTQPADTLSEFERRTLHMLSQRLRRYPNGISWPDTEF